MKTNSGVKCRMMVGAALVLALLIPDEAAAASLTGRKVSTLSPATRELATKILAQLELSIVDKDVRQLLGLMRTVTSKPVLSRDVLLDNNNPALTEVGRIPIPASTPVERVRFQEVYSSTSGRATFTPPGAIGFSGLGNRDGFQAGTIAGAFSGTADLPSGLNLSPIPSPGAPINLSLSGELMRIGDGAIGHDVSLTLGTGSLAGTFTSSNFSIGRNGSSQGTFTGSYVHPVMPFPQASATINYGATLLVPSSTTFIVSPAPAGPVVLTPFVPSPVSSSSSLSFQQP